MIKEAYEMGLQDELKKIASGKAWQKPNMVLDALRQSKKWITKHRGSLGLAAGAGFGTGFGKAQLNSIRKKNEKKD